MDDRLQIAAMCLQGMLANSDGRGFSFDENLRAMPESAFLYADRLLELHKVPAPSGGPAADSPSASSLTPTVQGVNKSEGGGSAPTPPTVSNPEYKVSRLHPEHFPAVSMPEGAIWTLWVDEQGRRCSNVAADIHTVEHAQALAAILGWKHDSEWARYGDQIVAEAETARDTSGRPPDHEHVFDSQLLCKVCGNCALDLAESNAVGAAAPRAAEALAGAATPNASEVNPGIAHSPAGENPARPSPKLEAIYQKVLAHGPPAHSMMAAGVLPSRKADSFGAASPQAVEDAAARIAPPGDLALPPSATAGPDPARPSSPCDEECFAHHKYDFNPHDAPPSVDELRDRCFHLARGFRKSGWEKPAEMLEAIVRMAGDGDPVVTIIAEERDMLLARDVNVRSLLRAIQWAGWDGSNKRGGLRTGICPNCWADGRLGKHLPHCELRALLRAPAEPAQPEHKAGPLSKR